MNSDLLERPNNRKLRLTRGVGFAAQRCASSLGWTLALAGTVALVFAAVGKTVAPRVRDRGAPPALSAHGLGALPVAARGVVSAALGADRRVYRIATPAAGGWGWNPAQRLHVHFADGGVTLYAGGLRVGLGLREFGYGTTLHAVRPTLPRMHANGVSYARVGLREWYRDGPLGLEQGFTVAHAPRGSWSGRPLTLALALWGNGAASVTDAGHGLVFAGAGGRSVDYTGLLASDARGRSLHSWLELHGRRALLRVDARGALYPLRIDPLIEQGPKLVGGEAEGKGEFGASIALSANGDTALIGGADDDGGIGAAWVFVRSGSTWVQQGPKLTGGEYGEEGKGEFGAAVALSADGDTALIGGPGDDGGRGAAWGFIRLGSTWLDRGTKLTGSSEQAAAKFGAAVALSADGDTALVGEVTGKAPYGGTAWMFRHIGPPVSGTFEKWTQLEVTSGLTGEEGDLGATVALSSNGDMALVGSPFDTFEVGAVVVFTRSGETWQQSEVLRGEGEVGEDQFGALGEIYFGTSMALSGDGNTLLVGGPGDNHSIGALWVFERSGSAWRQQKVTADGEVGASSFGTSVALSSAGGTALVGAPGEGGAGAVWLLKRSGPTWTQDGPPLTGEGTTGAAHFGATVALSATSELALVGGPEDNAQDGAVWTFVSVPPGALTGAATNVQAATTTLNGAVDPNELASKAYFQYGPTSSYGQATAAGDVGAGDAPVPFASPVAGLAPATTYHYRIVGASSAGASYGADQTFTTALPSPLNTSVPVISGTAIRGRPLSVSQGEWANAPGSYAYQWQSCNATGKGCVVLPGVIGSLHVLTQADVGHRLRAVVTATNGGGSSAATSSASPVVGSQVKATMTWTFGWSRRYTIVEALVVHGMPAAASIVVRCSGFGCPFIRASAAGSRRCGAHGCKRRQAAKVRGEVSLARLFKGHRLGVGSRIAVSILENGWVGKSFSFTTRAGRAPQYQISCLAPGSEQPQRSC